MKILVILGSLALSVAVNAAPVKVLDCGTSFGPDQNVSVEQDAGKLRLVELTNHGQLVSRELTDTEWNSGSINLREEFGYKATLTLEKRGGAYIHVTDGEKYNESGPADCN